MGTKYSKKSVLVVDDTPENIDVLRGILEAQYTVMAASGGRQALKAAFSPRPPDLILLDVLMPEMDGYEVCRQLKADERTQHIPVIFVTAKSEAEDEARGFELGAADYIVKPLSAPIVLARVGTHLALYEHYRHLQGVVKERTASLIAKSQEVESALERASEAERRIITISEETQRRIGQELHDDLGQQLTGIAFMSELLAKKLHDENHPASAEAATITAFINEAISKTRKLAQGLYPVVLNESGLAGMLENLVQSVIMLYPVGCELICEGDCTVTEPLTAINLFRIAQEAVNNAIKHSGAGSITLRLSGGGEGLTLEIIDDGCGISLPDMTGDGLGMHSMRYRASLLGAAFSVRRADGGGTAIKVTLPAAQ